MAKDKIGKVIISQDDYDKLLDTFDRMDTRTLDMTFVPSKEDVDSKLLPYLTTNEMTFCYLMWLDSAITVTPENKEKMAYIRNVIKQHVVFLNQDAGVKPGVN